MRSPFPPHQTLLSSQQSRLDVIGVLLLTSPSIVAL
jgi:hypothetical protein